MTEKSTQGYLKEISPDMVVRNPDNPRLFFRPDEMDTLMGSIRRNGIQVPVSVYEDDGKYVLIDGERRWRCARKLNLQRIPALIQKKPSPLVNLLLMFNIHMLREQWDYFTIASKLPNVISLYKEDNQGKEPTEAELADISGLTRGQIRHCRLLMDLPGEYKKKLEDELSLPKHLQVLSEDFFIEMERALKTVQRRVPSVVPELNPARDALIDKFRSGTIDNITDFRKLSKIATSISNLGAKEAKVRSAIGDILNPDKKTGIKEVFAEQFEMRYDERRIVLTIDSIYEYLKGSMEGNGATALGADVKRRLLELKRMIERVLRG
jgi:ParB family transcriptional regulator, chromosome partitioning protein